MVSMQQDPTYLATTLTRADVEATAGPAVLDFGTNWCSICRAALPKVEAAFTAHASVRHTRVEDGPGRALGRAYGIKLWPTLIFLRDGAEVARLVRPTEQHAIGDALRAIDGCA